MSFYNKYLEATPGFEPGNKGFAVLCLATWLCRLIHLPYCSFNINKILQFSQVGNLRSSSEE